MISTFHFPSTIFHGAGSIQRLTEACELLGAKHLFVIASKRVQEEMQPFIEKKLPPELRIDFFTSFTGEPTTEHLAHSLKRLQSTDADCIIAIGGGSPMDLAKAVAALAANPGLRLQDIHRVENLQRYPLIAVPTTAGTGSEATKITVITDAKTSKKYNPGHPALIPDIAILDPELTLHLPKQHTAQTGIDALAHAMEAYVSTKASPMTDTFALEAIRLIGNCLHEAYYHPDYIEAREGMLRASYFAGIAFSNASTNLAHATARPLGARFNLPHGLSVALTLPHVIAYGLEIAEDRYAEIAEALNTTDILDYINNCNIDFQINQTAKEMIEAEKLDEMIPQLTEDALSGNGILTNRKVPNKEEITLLYKNIVKILMEE